MFPPPSCRGGGTPYPPRRRCPRVRERVRERPRVVVPVEPRRAEPREAERRRRGVVGAVRVRVGARGPGVSDAAVPRGAAARVRVPAARVRRRHPSAVRVRVRAGGVHPPSHVVSVRRHDPAAAAVHRIHRGGVLLRRRRRERVRVRVRVRVVRVARGRERRDASPPRVCAAAAARCLSADCCRFIPCAARAFRPRARARARAPRRSRRRVRRARRRWVWRGACLGGTP